MWNNAINILTAAATWLAVLYPTFNKVSFLHFQKFVTKIDFRMKVLKKMQENEDQ